MRTLGNLFTKSHFLFCPKNQFLTNTLKNCNKDKFHDFLRILDADEVDGYVNTVLVPYYKDRTLDPAALGDIKTKRCPKCFVEVVKEGGCNTITCRCGWTFPWDDDTFPWDNNARVMNWPPYERGPGRTRALPGTCSRVSLIPWSATQDGIMPTA